MVTLLQHCHVHILGTELGEENTGCVGKAFLAPGHIIRSHDKHNRCAIAILLGHVVGTGLESVAEDFHSLEEILLVNWLALGSALQPIFVVGSSDMNANDKDSLLWNSYSSANDRKLNPHTWCNEKSDTYLACAVLMLSTKFFASRTILDLKAKSSFSCNLNLW